MRKTDFLRALSVCACRLEPIIPGLVIEPAVPAKCSAFYVCRLEVAMLIPVWSARGVPRWCMLICEVLRPDARLFAGRGGAAFPLEFDTTDVQVECSRGISAVICTLKVFLT